MGKSAKLTRGGNKKRTNSGRTNSGRHSSNVPSTDNGKATRVSIKETAENVKKVLDAKKQAIQLQVKASAEKAGGVVKMAARPQK